MSTVSIPAALENLVSFLNSLDERVPIDELRVRLDELNLSVEDLEPFLHFSNVCYQRNLVCQGEWYELLCICWEDGQSSLIHNHEGSTCGLRIVEGSAIERRFHVDAANNAVELDRRDFHEGDVCCTQDADVHQICNTKGSGQRLVTLHIYSPPLVTMQTWCESAPRPR